MIGHSGKRTFNYVRDENETSMADGTREHVLITSGGEATDAEYVRVMLAQGYQWTEDEVERDLERYASRPFKLLK